MIPEEHLPDWAAKSDAKATILRAPVPVQPVPLPANETAPAVVMSATTEPALVLTAQPKPKMAVTAAAAVTAPAATAAAAAPAATTAVAAPAVVVSTATVPVSPFAAPSDLGMVWALLVLILVGPAVLSTQLPFGRFVAVAIALLGVIGGVACLGAEGKARLAAASAAVLHLGALVVVLFLPGWLNLGSWLPPGQAEGPSGPVEVENRSGVLKPIALNGWLDAAKASWQFRDARVSLRAALIGPVEVRGAGGTKRTTKESYLLLVVQVTNVGLDHDVQLPDWIGGATEGVGVTDANEQPVAPAALGADGPAPGSGQRVAPGHSTEARFVFTAPSKSAWIQVRLSAAAFGAPDDIRLRAAPGDRPARVLGK